MNKYYIILLSLFFGKTIVIGQDLHLSNYLPAGVLFNPGMTGMNGADLQFGFQYRSQWSAIPDPYTTTGATVEGNHKNLGLGLQIFQKQAGAASLKTTGVMLTGSYHKRLSSDGLLSLGLGLGRLQKRFNPALFTFDNQYSEGIGFDSALPTGENFVKTTKSITDFTIGLGWTGSLDPERKTTGTAGFSLSHIHLPNESFIGDITELPVKTLVHAQLDFTIDNQLILSPNLLFQKQGVHKEVVAGLKVSGTVAEQTRMHFGMGYRLKDAIIAQVGLDYNKKSIWISYDANASGLKKATGGKGAWELGLYLQLDRNKKKRLEDRDGDGIFDNRDKCPKIPGLPEYAGCPNQIAQPEPVLTLKEDSDQDGVTDDLDRCPLEPGFPCFYGCNDRDRDGTLDQDDSCPEIFGPPDNKGCPIKGMDSDKDGVPDSEDYCVFLKGLPEFHGCPDSDRDGISDIDDECPYIKGTKQNQGCPEDKNTSPFELHRSSNVIVEFDTDKSYIKPMFKSRLDEFVKNSDFSQNYKLMLAGHTDIEGDDAYNYELGMRRARSVKDYLWQLGIPYDKMEMISYGEAIPKSPNSTEEGKARNRRTEVILVNE